MIHVYLHIVYVSTGLASLVNANNTNNQEGCLLTCLIRGNVSCHVMLEQKTRIQAAILGLIFSFDTTSARRMRVRHRSLLGLSFRVTVCFTIENLPLCD